MSIHLKAEPKEGQESVWDYPRPPKIESCTKHIKVVFNDEVVADSTHTIRVLEKTHPPVYYIPVSDVKTELLSPADNHSFCEWKGEAAYFHLTAGGKTARYACWLYPDPVEGSKLLKDHIAFYAQKMDACYVDGEKVRPQPGKFYGGWITKDIVGPFKGGEGSENW